MKQLLTNIFGTSRGNEDVSIEKNTSSEQKETTDTVSDLPVEYSKKTGWKLDFVYKTHDESPVHFSVVTPATEDLTERDRNKSVLQNMISNIHSQLTTVDEDTGFINVDNSLVIRKNQFVSVAILSIQ